MRNIIIDFLNSDTWKIQLTIPIDSVSSKDVEEERVINSTSDNKNLVQYKDVNEVINELFESLHSRYQGNLETSMRAKDFIFDSVQLMYYKCHKVNFSRDGSYIDFPG